jgi:molybdopterin/thiamine biosynthesis adenylyltransferase
MDSKQASYPEWLTAKAADPTASSDSITPIVITMAEAAADEQLQQLADSQPISHFQDRYGEMLEELFFSRHPQLKLTAKQADQLPQYGEFVAQLLGEGPLWQTGAWVYYPWSQSLVHVLPKDLHREVRTNRNRDLITPAEQQPFLNFKVGIVGLSIGQAAVQVLSMLGGCLDMHLADFDQVSLTNLNRLRLGLDSIGISKTVMAARTIAEVDPYAHPQVFSFGLTSDNLDQFFDGLQVVVDEVDDFPMKLQIREQAAKRKIPVLMAADLGDAIMLDVERYDLNPQQQPFNGRVDQAKLDQIRQGQPNPALMLQAFVDVVGKQNIPAKSFEVIKGIGTVLAGPPQLGSDAMLSGICIATALRHLAVGATLEPGIRYVSLNEVFSHAQS